MPRRLGGWTLLAAVLVTIVWSGRAFVDYGRLAGGLAGGSLEERGALGCNESENFLARAGRPGLRARVDLRPQPSTAMGDVWRWLVRTRPRLGDGARVRLNVDSPLIYYYATTLWYPSHVDVTGNPQAVIKDSATLSEKIEPVGNDSVAELRRRGYTHLAGVTSEGLTLVDLAEIP